MMRRCKHEIGRGHLASQLHDALAEDERTNILDIEVQIVGDECHLHGEVASEELKRHAEAIAQEITEGMTIHNRLRVVGPPALPPQHEQIR